MARSRHELPDDFLGLAADYVEAHNRAETLKEDYIEACVSLEAEGATIAELAEEGPLSYATLRNHIVKRTTEAA